MKFVCFSAWDQLPAGADLLFEQEEKNSVFFSRRWFECMTVTARDHDQTLVLASVVSGDQVLAMLPLIANAGNRTWYSLRHGFTPIYSLLLTNENQEQVLSCMASALSQLPVNGLLLEPAAEDDNTIFRLQVELEKAGFRCERLFRHYNWIHRVRGESYQQYLAGRPAKLRNTIVRKKRKLDREHGYTIRLFTGDEVPRGMVDYYVVYNASWKQNEIDNAKFQDCIVEEFSKAGWSRLGVLYVNEQPVAAQLWFVHHHKAKIFRLAYDKAWRQYSTGSILTGFMMEHVIDIDMVQEIDFLTGNEAYKQDWMSERRELCLLSCTKSISPTSRVVRFIEAMKHMLKRK